MTCIQQPPILKSKFLRFGINDPKKSWHAIYDGNDLMVKMGKLVPKFENRYFRMNFLKKMVK
jgi:ribosomal protein L31